ncbi:MAG: hypothetical protein ACHRXM_29610 [Isosphaerales bacterium]
MNASIALFLSYVALSAVPTSADPKPVPITGIVVEPSGRPAPGADVWLVDALTADQGRRFGMEAIWSSQAKPSEGTIPVLLHGRTNPAGRFTLDLTPEIVARRVPPVLAIWTATSGPDPRLASQLLPRIGLAGEPPLRLEPASPMRTEITVLDPAQSPLAHARIIPSRASDIPVPDPLGVALAATTDPKGRAFVSGLVPDEIRVEAPGFGAQTMTIPGSRIPDSRIQGETDRTITVTLAPVGRVEGRLVAPRNEPIKGAMLRATTQVGGYAGSGQGGSAEVSCDAQGRFDIPAIAVGPLTLMLVFDRENGTPLRGEPPQKLLVSAGRATQVTIPLRPTIKVRGQYREQGTKRPIGGVKILLNGRFGGDRHAITGADGTWSGWISRDVYQPFAWPLRIPAPYYRSGDMAFGSQRMPAAGSNELVLPPVEVPRGVEVTGSVVNERGEPVAGAQIEADWEFRKAMLDSIVVRTDQSGRFALCGVDPIAELRLSAWDGFASTAADVTIRAEAARTKPVVLTIDPKNTVPVGGRVIDPAGNPVAGASIQLWHRVRARDGREMVIEPIMFGDRFRSIRTDSRGRYRAPRRLPLGGEYDARAVAPGRPAAFSGAVRLTGESQELPAILLRRVRTIEGQMVDRQDKPVAGGVVRQSGDGPMPTHAMTAQDGHFQLAGVLEGPVVVFAEMDGFRFHFQPIDDGPKPIKIVLTRTTEAPPRTYQTLAPARPVEEEKALARRLMQPCAEKMLAKGNDDDKFRFLLDAIDVDPRAVLEWMGTVKFNDADYLSPIRLKSIVAQARDSLDEATAVIEASTDATLRAQGYAEICEVRRDLDPPRVKELLTQAMINARAAEARPVARTALPVQIADRLIDIGEIEQARKLLQDAERTFKETTKNADRTGHLLGRIAGVLARIDLPAALAIIDDLERAYRKNVTGDTTSTLDGLNGTIAVKLAAQAPADAERVLTKLSLRVETVRYIAAVCFKMAPKDLARSRRIADSRISPDAPAYRPYTLGLMAQAIAATDNAGAARLINDAYRGLEDLAALGQPHANPGPLKVAAGLLPVVEQVEPERLAEFLGRTLALLPASGDQNDLGEVATVRSKVLLAMMVARYDRQLAARLLELQLREIGTHSIRRDVRDFATANVLTALALIDPQQAVERVEALPDDPGAGTDPNTTKNRARMEVAKMLALHGADRWRHLYENLLNLWTPDQRYL